VTPTNRRTFLSPDRKARRRKARYDKRLRMNLKPSPKERHLPKIPLATVA
jgi:hypothetical protein